MDLIRLSRSLSLSLKLILFSILLLILCYRYHIPDASILVARQSSNLDELITPLATSHISRRLSQPAKAADGLVDGDSSCGPDKPCSNGACCSSDGWCGYGSLHCGDGCQSNCNATAECGQFASEPGVACPLNVCCSEFGFCGTTNDFCKPGCQSNCNQPKPSSSPSDSQKRIIGYWEAWNTQNHCGAMSIGDIPVSKLTHLNVAFGYIDPDFQITNMDGVSSDIYRNIGNVKSRNPDIKILIALGGWTFSDPGPSQSIFPTLVSNAANRAIFIANLLRFLSEYGYDGVDFDWEYPGADDRGGSDQDAANYVLLLKELQAAINSTGVNYLVTFTAPTSYWYLRHFDVKGMEQYVNWINLMSYDLHGVWDGNNPIGNKVLSHTNLTEIDLALNLFWRVGVEPSNIVLGLGFYGRSFALQDPSCWKPGCPFTGPGSAGRCTDTAGILSYREIKDILARTGGSAYLDESAAARYIVYDNTNWVSFDDATTFQSKINYANKMGLSGLMIWAIDLDDNWRTALSAVSNIKSDKRVATEFTQADIENLFPADKLPNDGAVSNYALINFGGSSSQGDMNPSNTGFGFMMITGDSFAVTNLKKRQGQPDPFVFLDCPGDVESRPPNETLRARVACLSDDVQGCFRVLERGIEGTIVDMPENCAPNRFARAIELKVSEDQSLPEHLSKRQITSKVFEFSFDFNIQHARVDTNNTSIRMDYSNMKGYWDAVVNSPGIQSSQENEIKERFFSPDASDWIKIINTIPFLIEDALVIKEDVSAPVLWETVDECYIGGDYYGEGIGAVVKGTVDAKMWYGFSVIAKGFGGQNDQPLVISEANGFIKVEGQSDLEFAVGGIGELDINKANRGNPATSEFGMQREYEGHEVSYGDLSGNLTFIPYFDVKYLMATSEGLETILPNATAAFNGRLRTRVVSDFGDFVANFPLPEDSEVGSQNDHRNSNQIEVFSDNVLYGSTENGSQIVLGTEINFGMRTRLDQMYLERNGFAKPPAYLETWLPEMSLLYRTLTNYLTYPGDPDHKGTSCTDIEVRTEATQDYKDGEIAGWPSQGHSPLLILDVQTPAEGGICYIDVDSGLLDPAKRSLDEPRQIPPQNHAEEEALRYEEEKSLVVRQSGKRPGGWDLSVDKVLNPAILQLDLEYFLMNRGPQLACENNGCTTCAGSKRERCCGCIDMYEKWGYSDIGQCESCGLVDDDQPEDPAEDPGEDSQGISESSDLESPSWQTPNATKTSKYRDPDGTVGKAASGSPKPVSKRVVVCGEKLKGSLDSRYPPFPINPAWPWDGVLNGRYDSISRYWGNTSADCADWSVDKLTPADTTTAGKRRIYQTEHVFEGQLLGDFFTHWLDKGKIVNQRPVPTSSAQKLNCTDWTQKWIIEEFSPNPWKLNQKDSAFIYLLMAELGSIAHLDRLTIFLGRPNRMKGAMFSGYNSTATSAYLAQGHEEQLQSVKEMGMVFTYLNRTDVWDSFCGAYEGIYDTFDTFDPWYEANRNGDTKISLKDEWKAYMRVVLDSLVIRTVTMFDWMYDNKKPFNLPQDLIYQQKWIVNLALNRKLLNITRTCDNMDQSTLTPL